MKVNHFALSFALSWFECTWDRREQDIIPLDRLAELFDMLTTCLEAHPISKTQTVGQY